MSRESDGLVGRIRHMRRSASVAPYPASSGEPDANLIQNLQTRVAALEQLIQGLQDSVYRESHRQEKRIAALELQLDPAVLAAALSKDARDRGL